MMRLWLLCVCLAWDAEAACDGEERLLSSPMLALPADYDKFAAPPEKPTRVAIIFMVDDLLNVDDLAYAVKLKVRIMFFWNDSRLLLNHEMLKELRPNNWFALDPHWRCNLWFPDANVKGAQSFETVVSWQSSENLFITNVPHLRLFFMAEHVVKFTCPLKFEDFPFDRHECPFKITAGSSRATVELDFALGDREAWGWGNTTTILNYDTSFSALDEDEVEEEEIFPGGLKVKKSVAGFKIRLKRQISMYVFDYYIPSGLFVVVSWVSLIIPPDAIPGRITLIITTLLVLVNIANTIFSNSPRAYAINPIQIWILACIAFVFVTVLEYALLLLLLRRAQSLAQKSDFEELQGRKGDEVALPALPSTYKPGVRRKTAITPVECDRPKSHVDTPPNSAFTNRETENNDDDDNEKNGDDLWHSLRYVRSALFERVPGDAHDDARLRLTMAKLDYVCFWTLVLCFAAFNAAYWSWNIRA